MWGSAFADLAKKAHELQEQAKEQASHIAAPSFFNLDAMQSEPPDQPAALFSTPQPSFSSSNHTETLPQTLEKELTHKATLPSSPPAIELPERNQMPKLKETIPSEILNETNLPSDNRRNHPEPQDVLKSSVIGDAVEDSTCAAASSMLVAPDSQSEGWDDDAFDVDDEDEIEVEPSVDEIHPDDEILMNVVRQSDQPVDMPDTLETTESSLDEVISEKINDGGNVVSEAFEETISLVVETQLLNDRDDYPTATSDGESQVETCVDKAHESIVGENDEHNVVASNNDREVTPEPNEDMAVAENEIICALVLANGDNSVDEYHSPENVMDEFDKIVGESNETVQVEEVVLPQISLSKVAPDDSMSDEAPEDTAKSQILSSDEAVSEMDDFQDASVEDDAEEVTHVALNDSTVSMATDDVNNEVDAAKVELVAANKGYRMPHPSLCRVCNSRSML